MIQTNTVANFNNNKNKNLSLQVGLQEKLVGDLGTSSDKPITFTENFKELSNNYSAKDKSTDIQQSKQSFRNYFKVSNKNKSQVECTLCGYCWIPQLKSGIRNHLKSHHFNEFLKFNKVVKENSERKKKRPIEDAYNTVASFNNNKNKKRSLQEKLLGDHGTSSDKPIENFKKLSKNSSAKDESKEIPQSKQSFRKYFKVSDKDKGQVECTLCGSCWIPQVKYGIRNHLKKQHTNEFLKFSKIVDDECDEMKKKIYIED